MAVTCADSIAAIRTELTFYFQSCINTDYFITLPIIALLIAAGACFTEAMQPVERGICTSVRPDAPATVIVYTGGETVDKYGSAADLHSRLRCDNRPADVPAD